MSKATTQIQERRVLASDLPRTVKSVILEAGIVPDEFNAEQLLKKGAVIVNHTSAHPGMTVNCSRDENIQISIYDERWWVFPVSQEEMLENYDPNERFKDSNLRKLNANQTRN